MKDLINLVKQAGVLALKEQENISIQTKADTSIVTNGDLVVSEFLEKSLAKMYPDYDIFSEENSKKIPTKNKVIVIDPIDGTQSYSRKQNTWTILIGFLENNVPTMGIIYQPTSDLLYYAAQGNGAYLLKNGITTKLDANREGTFKAYSSPTRKGENEYLKEMNIEDIEYMYSASLKIAEIAQGHGDIYPNFQQKCSLWDLVAPTVILQEAGGQVIYEKDPGVNFPDPRIKTRLVAVGPRLKSFKFNK